MVATATRVGVGLKDSLRITAAKHSWTFYKYQNSVIDADIADRRIRVPLFDRIGLYNLEIDDRDLRFVALLRRLLEHRPGVVIDVGANIGQFMLRVLLADPDRAWLGFEPLVPCCNYVEHLIRENRLANHRVLPLGLGSHADIVDLFYSNETDVSASAIDGFYSDQKMRLHKSIIVDRGDAILDRMGGFDAVSLLKIDTEGGECDVLEGFAGTIAGHQPLLIVEIAPYAHVADEGVRSLRQRRIGRLGDIVNDLGYTLYRIRNGGTLEPVEGRVDPGASIDLMDMDYLGVPRGADTPRL